MSQNDLNVINQGFPSFRADLNSALQALGSNSSGPNAPTTTYADMTWYDTSTNIIKIRSNADDAWIDMAYLDQSTNKFKLLDNTGVVTAAGVSAGIIGDQPTSNWETGTVTTQSLVSPKNVADAVAALSTSGGLQFISSIVISNDASLEFTGFDSTKYDAYTFVFSNIIPTTDVSGAQIRLSSNGGATYDSGSGDYRFIRLSSTGSSTMVATNSLSSFGLGSFSSGAAALESGNSGELTIYGPHLANMKTMILLRSTTTDNSGDINSSINSIRHNRNVAVNAIQFYASGTTLATGTITMYGMVNA
jgi:hypothetical protein|tara:strand:+ start:3444 stop:4358 length:915 start_codon:yes stop_codon:yes gene_type:complete